MKRSDYAQHMSVRCKTAWRAKHNTETSVREPTCEDTQVADEQEHERDQEVVAAAH
jgi:hypothetical protein